jgi:hypothetical protein
VRRPNAARFLLSAWDALETHIIEKGWGIFEDVLGGSDADSDDEDPSWEPEVSGIKNLTLDDFDLDPRLINEFPLFEFSADVLDPKTAQRGL